jgi:hypothetical protein
MRPCDRLAQGEALLLEMATRTVSMSDICTLGATWTLACNECGDHRLPDETFLKSFSLPGSNRAESLAHLHPFPDRDAQIQFDEQRHVYSVNGEEYPVSVTSWLHRFYKEFDSSVAIQKMRNGNNWPMKRLQFLWDDGTEMDDLQIAALWKQYNAVCRARGTLMHYQIEQNLNGRSMLGPYSPEFKQFLQFRGDWFNAGTGRFPERTELSLFHEELKIAGQADLLCKERDGTYSVIDWKRCKQLKFSNPFDNMLKPLDHLPDCNYNQYCLQLNMYRYLLETKYDKNISSMHIVVFHPNQVTYDCRKIERMESEISAIVNLRLRELNMEPSVMPARPAFTQ